MSGKFNPANSEYNKDDKFATVSTDDTVKLTFKEAIATEGDEKYFTIWGWVLLPLVGVEKMGDRNWTGEECLVKVRVPKKDFENEYNGKKTQIKQSPGMRAALHLIKEHGWNTPFSGFFDFSMAEGIATSIVEGKNPDGSETKPHELEMINQYFMRLEPLEELDKLKGIEIKDSGGKGGYRGGGGGQKESEKLGDRMTFLKGLMDGNETFEALCVALDGEDAPKMKERVMRKLIDNLFN